MLLDAKMRDMLSMTLFSQWQIEDIRQTRETGTGGLLNEPVQKLRIRHDGIETVIAVKTLGVDPRLLFRSLYEKFGFADRRQLDDFDQYCSYLSMREMPLRNGHFMKIIMRRSMITFRYFTAVSRKTICHIC